MVEVVPLVDSGASISDNLPTVKKEQVILYVQTEAFLANGSSTKTNDYLLSFELARFFCRFHACTAVIRLGRSGGWFGRSGVVGTDGDNVRRRRASVTAASVFGAFIATAVRS